ncbi:MAG: hypothetical protein ACWA49_11825 [Ruegeria sp.]
MQTDKKNVVLLIDDQSAITREIHFEQLDLRVVSVDHLFELPDIFEFEGISIDQVACVFVDMFMPGEKPQHLGLPEEKWVSDWVGLHVIEKYHLREGSSFQEIPVSILTGHRMDEATVNAVLSFRSRYFDIPVMKKLAPNDSSHTKGLRLKRISEFVLSNLGRDADAVLGFDHGIWNANNIDIKISRNENDAIFKAVLSGEMIPETRKLRRSESSQFRKGLVIECVSELYRELSSECRNFRPTVVGYLNGNKLVPSDRFSAAIERLIPQDSIKDTIIRDLVLDWIGDATLEYGAIGTKRWALEAFESSVTVTSRKNEYGFGHPNFRNF